MIKTLAALTLSLMVPAAVLADVPATQPAAAVPASTEAKVLVVMFQPVEPTDPDWIGRAVQQSLVADLSRTNTSTSIQPFADQSRVSSVNEAIDAGKHADARYVIFGSYQRIDPTLRITGQIVDISTGKVVAGLKATGSDRELFDMQDTLAFQAKWGLGTERLAQKTAAAKADAQATAPPEIPALGPVQAGERYMDSDLSKAVADGRSLIERDDAAGQSYRREYYDDSTPAGYDGYYGWNGYYGGFGPWGYPYGWWWGSRTIIIKGNNCIPTHAPFSQGPNTMQFTNGNYITPTSGNYIKPTGGNYIRPTGGNFVAPSRGGMAPSTPSSIGGGGGGARAVTGIGGGMRGGGGGARVK